MPHIRSAAITDEFSPQLETALARMAAIGMQGAELRVIDGRNIVDLTDEQIDRAKDLVGRHGLEVIGLASPLLKCELPDAPPLDMSFQQDRFGVDRRYEDQPALTERTFEIAERLGTPMIRVFSFWRTIDPAACFDRVVEALWALADLAAARGLIIALENEHACHVGTAAEAAAVARAIAHPALKLLWDPANALVAGEVPYPDGYRALPAPRVVHVHAKDCVVAHHRPTWGAVGEMDVDWRGQIAALIADDYRGWISLETHWTGPNGDKLEASTICGANLRRLIDEAEARSASR